MQAIDSQNSPTSVILGATSALGQAVARRLVSEGHRLVLCARDEDRLDAVAKDLRVRSALAKDETKAASDNGTDGDSDFVKCYVVDFDLVDNHEALITAIDYADHFWFFYGTLPNQAECESDWEQSAAAWHTNFISVASLLSRLAQRLEPRGHGSLIVVTSVAGNRGRKSNYVYGTSKGALSLFCQGLRNRLSASGVQVLTVKPGFIDTPMTAGMEKKPAALWASPDQVAADMIRAHKRGKDEIYSRWFWRYIMLIIQHIPERIFKKLSL